MVLYRDIHTAFISVDFTMCGESVQSRVTTAPLLDNNIINDNSLLLHFITDTTSVQ